MLSARATIFALLVTTAGAGFAEAVSDEMTLADLAGRDDVATAELGLADAQWGNLPPVEALAYFRSKKLMTPDEFKGLEDGYKARGFAVAGLTQRYTLERVHGMLSDAIENGTTKREFTKALDEQYSKWGLSKLGRYHIETIFDTNVLGAYAAGRFTQMTRPETLEARPFWQYKAVKDGRERPTHGAMHNRVIPASSPIWDEWYPPNGYRCRCAVISLSQDDVQGRGLSVETELPGKIEDGTQVFELMPDRGFSGSPRTQARADGAVVKVSTQVRASGALQPPELAGAGSDTVHRTAGDLVDVPRRAATVDAMAGLDPAKATRLCADHATSSIYPGGVTRVAKNETWVEVGLPSQHLDTAEQLLVRLAGEGKVGHLVDGVQVTARATYAARGTVASVQPEVVLADSIARSTETVLRIVTRTGVELTRAAELALQSERGHGLALRRAADVGQVMVRGAELGQAAEGYAEAWLNTRRMGTGEQAVLTRERPLDGWKSERVHVTQKMRDTLPEGGEA